MFRLGFRGAAAVTPSPDTEILQRLLTECRFGIPADRSTQAPLGCLSVARVIRGARGRTQLSDAAAFSAYATAEPPRQNATDTSWHEALGARVVRAKTVELADKALGTPGWSSAGH
jgi:hypothetical protein